jgi:hypothetical protein
MEDPVKTPRVDPTFEAAVRRWLASPGEHEKMAVWDEWTNNLQVREVVVDGVRVLLKGRLKKSRRGWFRRGKEEEARAWMRENGWDGGSVPSFLHGLLRERGPAWPSELFNIELDVVPVRRT